MKNIDKSLEKAIDFLIDNQNNGLWSDFCTNHHYESIDWVSAYTALALLRANTKVDLSITTNSLAKRQNQNGGWGYNKIASPDADTTSFAIVFLQKFGYNSDLDKARKFIQKHKNLDGSFSSFTIENVKTYYRTRDINVDGWTVGIPDVTAIVARVISEKGKTIEYLINSQRKDGSFPAYWWNQDIYSTTQIIITLNQYGHKNQIEKAQEWLNKQSSEIPFYQALVIEGLTINNKHTKKVKDKLNNLLEKQLPDGSWPSYPILRFPHPSNLDPWNDKKRWTNDKKDQKRIFTTATCINAILAYKEMK